MEMGSHVLHIQDEEDDPKGVVTEIRTYIDGSVMYWVQWCREKGGLYNDKELRT